MRRAIVSICATFLVVNSSPAAASGPSTSATDTLTLHGGAVVAATAQGLYRWDGIEWALWHPWTLRGVATGALSVPRREDQLERLRAFDEVVDELLPSYGEQAAIAAAEALLGFIRPRPKLVFEGVQETADTLPRAVLNTVSHRGWFWACTVDGVRRVGATVHRIASMGHACYDLVAGSGRMIAATERGFFELLQPGEWARLAGPLASALIGIALLDGRAYAATADGIYELAERPIRRSGAVVDAFGRLGDRLVIVRGGKVAFVDAQGQARPAGLRVAGITVRADDGQFLVTTEELWGFDGNVLAWVPLRPGDGELRDALDYGGLWIATSSGVRLPERLAEDRLMARLGEVLSPGEAVEWGARIGTAMKRRGLTLPDADPALARWLPRVSLSFDMGRRRGIGVRDLEALADVLEIDPEDLDPDVLEAEREWRNDIGRSDWRALLRLTWRPAASTVASQRTRLESLRAATVRERRRISRRAARVLSSHLALQRRMILHPPRTVRSAARRLLQAQMKRALLRGILDQEIP